MSEFFDKSFYGNTVAEWTISLSIIAGSIIIGKLLYWLSGNIAKRITRKTKSELDDLIIDKIEEPIVMAIVIAGFWYGLSYLNLSDGFSNFMEKAFYVAITFDVSWLVVRLVDALIVEYLTPMVRKTEGDLDDQLLPIIRKSLRAVIWIIAIVVGLNNAGYDVGALIAGLGLGGLAFALAAKDSVANLFGGVTVFMDKPFKINDRIQIDGYDGMVTDIGLRSTKLKTLAGRIVTIPNKKFSDSYVENVTSEPNRKVSVTLGLTYDTSPEAVQKGIDILKDIDKNSKYTDQECIVYFDSFGDFSLNIQFTYYLKTEPDYWYLGPNHMNTQILMKFNEAGLDFAFPTQTIQLQKN